MNVVPRVSVVMSVYNGAAELRSSIESVLEQGGFDFEYIIVDDGSTDESAAILERFASADSRIHLIRQSNQGLTRALVRGCAAARGEFIARQDNGDLSLPGRLRAELAQLEMHTAAAFVSCGARFVGPEGELLYEVTVTQEDALGGLKRNDVARLRGPAHHGSTMFRRDLYERVGGYREQFYFAQDLDLWTRLCEHGQHIAIPTILYEAKFALGSISSLQRRRQIECAKVIMECARLRRGGKSDAVAIAKASSIRPEKGLAAPSERAAALYFVGTCLRNRSDSRARRYFREALRTYPLHFRAALRLLAG